MKWIRRKLGDRGAAVVEFAIVLPLLLLLLFGIIEFAIILYDKAMITNASREGARAGVVVLTSSDPSVTRSSVIDNAVNRYLYADYPDNSASLLISFSTADPPDIVTDPPPPLPKDMDHGDPLTVTVTYTYHFLLIPDFVSDLAGLKTTGLQLSAQTTMRAE